MAPRKSGLPRKKFQLINAGETAAQSVFNQLSTKNVPHIIENIFLYLDYESYKNCLKVSNTWKKLLTLPSFQKKATLVHEGIQKEKKRLWYASNGGNVEEVRRLLSSGLIDTNYKMHGSTIMGQAAWEGHTHVVQVLLDAGADIHKATGLKKTPLHLAAEGGHINVVKLLLDKGAGPNVADCHGETPLHAAAMNGQRHVMKILLNRGADPNKENVDGKTPLRIWITEGPLYGFY